MTTTSTPPTVTQDDQRAFAAISNLEWQECDYRPNPDALAIIARHRIASVEAATAEKDAEIVRLEDHASVGAAVIDAISDLTAQDGPLKGLHPADCPSEVVYDLCNAVIDTEAERDQLRAKLDETLATLRFIAPSLPVLRDLCKGARLKRGADQAATMLKDVQAVLANHPQKEEKL